MSCVLQIQFKNVSSSTMPRMNYERRGRYLRWGVTREAERSVAPSPVAAELAGTFTSTSLVELHHEHLDQPPPHLQPQLPLAARPLSLAKFVGDLRTKALNALQNSHGAVDT